MTLLLWKQFHSADLIIVEIALQFDLYSLYLQTVSYIAVFQHKLEGLRVRNLSVHRTVGIYKQQYKMVASNSCNICNSPSSFSLPLG